MSHLSLLLVNYNYIVCDEVLIYYNNYFVRHLYLAFVLKLVDILLLLVSFFCYNFGVVVQGFISGGHGAKKLQF